MRLFHPPLRLSIFYGSRDQPRPGSYLNKREEPGNEVVEELRHDLNGAKIFSKLDGFHQLELDEESKGITTFSNHVGLRRYCRLNFGTNSAPEIFHEELRKKLELKGFLALVTSMMIYWYLGLMKKTTTVPSVLLFNASVNLV
jgi:hypothetical protein